MPTGYENYCDTHQLFVCIFCEEPAVQEASSAYEVRDGASKALPFDVVNTATGVVLDSYKSKAFAETQAKALSIVMTNKKISDFAKKRPERDRAALDAAVAREQLREMRKAKRAK